MGAGRRRPARGHERPGVPSAGSLVGACVGAGFGLPAVLGLVVGLAALLLAGVLVVATGVAARAVGDPHRPERAALLAGLEEPELARRLVRTDVAGAPCSTSMSPLPFALVAVVLVVLGVVLFARMRRAPRLIDPPRRTDPPRR